jgi:FkbM family methyltransferase
VDISPGDVVIDGGACEGFFSLYCFSKGASVISIEPNPVTANVLKRTLEPWIEKGKAIVVERLLGSKAGEMDLIIDPTNVGSSSIVDGWVTGSSVKVPMITLDQLVKELNLSRVDFVKLDVEGAERGVIKGAKTTIVEFQPKWAVAAYHLPYDYYVLVELLKSMYGGYKVDVRETVLRSEGNTAPFVRPLVIFAWE